MMASDDEANSLPTCILETQRFEVTGNKWSPTDETSDWFNGLLGLEAEPLPFQAVSPSASIANNGTYSTCPRQLKRLLCATEDGDATNYKPLVDGATDAEGWVYASAPGRFDVSRTGGRAGWRIGDRYRRRRWLQQHLCRATVAKLQATDHAKAMQNVSDFVRSLFAERGFSQVPLDPTAYLRRLQKDNAWYETHCRRLHPWTNVAMLEELLVATLYMRAAYGYVTRSGMFDSLVSGAMVFSLQKAIFDVAEDVDDNSNTAAFLDMMGLAASNVVSARWKAAGPCQPAYVLARDHEMQWIVLSVRGTITMKDMLTDMAAQSVPFLDGTAHEGFLIATEQLLNDVGAMLRDELLAHTGYRLVICGHSMGGAIAAMAAAKLRSEAPWAAGCVSYGIGTPSVLSRSIGERLAQEGAVCTVVNAQDWAPRFSTSNLRELMDDLCELGVLRTAMRLATGADFPAREEADATQEHLPAGAVLQIVLARTGTGTESSNDDNNNAEEAGQEKPDTRLCQADSTDFRHCMAVWPDFEAHLPYLYLRGLLQGFAALSAPPSPPVQAALLRCNHRMMPIPGEANAGGECSSASSFGLLPEEPDRGHQLVAQFLEIFANGCSQQRVQKQQDEQIF